MKITLIEALDTIHTASLQSKLSDELWTECEKEFAFLRSHTGLNNKQLVILACLCEAGDGLSWRGLGRELGLSRLKTMSLAPDIEDMKKRRWIVPYACRERGTVYEGFKQVAGIITAFRENRDFVPEVLEGMSEQAFVDRLARYVAKECADHDIPHTANNWWLLHFSLCNPDLPISKTVADLKSDMSKVILLRMIGDYAVYGGEHNEGMRVIDIDNSFEDGWELTTCLKELKEESHELFTRDLIEHACVEGMADMELFRLTRNAKETLLSEFVKVKTPPLRRQKSSTSRDILRADSIKPKQLFYDKSVEHQISRVSSILSPEDLPNIQERLEQLGHRKGICCLFYGAPGTGKTECVLQLARQTGRDVMQVNIASIRDKYVGETEKNIQGIFNRYRDLCKSSQTIPILLFNEADALINSRLETTNNSVEKMENSIQNIILQEMENLDGVLIATTNLTGTLDKAFDRRFLFKIEFNRPSIETKAAIWIDKLSYLNKKDALQLAHDFDFSGGQIENIARKSEIEFILSGSQPSLTEITALCREETLNRSNRPKIGF